MSWKMPARRFCRWSANFSRLPRCAAVATPSKSSLSCTSGSRLETRQGLSAPVFANVAAHLPAMARRQPDTTAVLCPAGYDLAGAARYVQWTFHQLDQESDCLARGLEAI